MEEEGKPMRDQVISRIRQEKLIAIVRGVQPEQCQKVAEALYEGGIRLLEITYNQSDPSGWIRTAEAIQKVKEQFGGEVLVAAAVKGEKK